MPELPEVEVVVRGIREVILGKVFWGVKVFNERTVNVSEEEFCYGIKKKRVLKVWRKGKYIIMELSPKGAVVIHLRMTGRLVIEKKLEREKFIRVEFIFTDGSRVFFFDVRKFGKVWFYEDFQVVKAEGLSHLGIDPFIDSFGIEDFLKLIEGKKGFVKNLLLDQSLVAGIGNIYADEICFRIGVHPKSRMENLGKDKLVEMHEAILFCLSEGIKYNGATIADFRGSRGDAGKFQDYLKVYGRVNDSCYSCGEIIIKMRAAGRGTFVCKKCQKMI